MKKIVLLFLFATCLYANRTQAQDKIKFTGEFPILGWYGIPAEETTVARYQEMKDAGFTLNFSFLGNADQVQTALDTAQAVSMKIVISCPELSSDPEGTVARFMNHPALAGYFLRDEPSMSDFAGLGDWARRIQAVDSVHFCYLNLNPNYAKSSNLGTLNYRTYVNTFINTVPLQFFTYWTPGCGSECFSNGPIYNGEKTDVYYKVQQVSKEIKGLSGVFLGSSVVSVHHTGNIPQGTTKLSELPSQIKALETSGQGAVVSVIERDSLAFLAVVNRDFRNSMKLIIKGDSTIQRVMKDGSLVPSAISHISTIDIGPGDIVVFTWPKGDSIRFVPIKNQLVNLPLDYDLKDVSGNELKWIASDNGGTSISDDRWHFVAVSFERNRMMNVNLDGDPMSGSLDMSSCPGNAYDATHNYRLTLMQDGTGGNPDKVSGNVDDLRFWSRALAGEEMVQIYASDTTGKSSEIVYLPLDIDLKDVSGNGFDATDVGTVATVFVSDPERGQVAYFDRLSQAALRKADPLRFGTRDFAFSLWIKCSAASYTPLLVCNKDWSALGATRKKGFALYTNVSNKSSGEKWSVNFADGDTEEGGSGNDIRWNAMDNDIPTIADDQWHFVAVSFDRSKTMDVYMDGQLFYPCSIRRYLGDKALGDNKIVWKLNFNRNKMNGHFSL